MSFWSKIANVFRAERVNRELDEELQAHLDEAIDRGRDPRAFGSALRVREASRDLKLVVWLDALRADVVFGWRQLLKKKIPSAAAVLSLALAIGACVSAFRIIDALLLRPLPVASPERLHFLAFLFVDHTGKVDKGEAFEYPHFRRLRAAVKGEAELMAISHASRIDLTYASGFEMEKAHHQFVSGWTFESFGLKPALGRLLTANDDVKPGAHPYAVLSHDYWQRRFGGDSKVIGRTFRTGGDTYEIVGVLERGFTGTETGTMTDIFVPTMMNSALIEDDGSRWFRTWVRLKPGAEAEPLVQKLFAASKAFREEKAKAWIGNRTQKDIELYVNAPVSLEPAAAGVSGMQRSYRQALVILGILVALVLVIACVNLANLMTAQAAARAREMALRVSIGAGRWRLVQMVLVESALIALAACALGSLFAWWAAPLVVGAINPPDNPARLILPADWRVLGFAVLLALGVTFLFGLAPALRASAVKPVSAIKGGEDPHARRRLMNALVAVQVAFCFLVHLIAGLFVATFDRLSNQPTGFSAERVLALDARADRELPLSAWHRVSAHLRTLPGVESVALASLTLMSGAGRNPPIWINGILTPDRPYVLGISPGWFETMGIRLLDGRDFRPEDAHPKAAIVNETFARRYLAGRNPIGQSFEMPERPGVRARLEIVGLVRDARYDAMRGPMPSTIYLPFHSPGMNGATRATFNIRTALADPMSQAALFRQEAPKAQPGMLITNIRAQTELVRMHTIRERLLAMLAFFFAVVSLLLAAVGLFGVLDFSVQQRRREIGIRMALGAQALHVARRVSVEVFAMVLIGAAAGLGAGVASEQYIRTLLYQVKATDFTMVALPVVTIFAAAILAAFPPVIRAVRIDPARMLRAD